VLTIVGGAIVTLAIIAALAARNGAEVLRWVGGRSCWPESSPSPGGCSYW